MINSNWGNSIAFSLKKYVYECLTEYNVQPKVTFQQAGLKRKSTSVRRFHSQCSLPDRPYTRLYPFMDTDLSYTEYQELSRRYHHFLGRNGNFRRAGARIARTSRIAVASLTASRYHRPSISLGKGDEHGLHKGIRADQRARHGGGMGNPKQWLAADQRAGFGDYLFRRARSFPRV